MVIIFAFGTHSSRKSVPKFSPGEPIKSNPKDLRKVLENLKPALKSKYVSNKKLHKVLEYVETLAGSSRSLKKWPNNCKITLSSWKFDVRASQ